MPLSPPEMTATRPASFGFCGECLIWASGLGFIRSSSPGWRCCFCRGLTGFFSRCICGIMSILPANRRDHHGVFCHPIIARASRHAYSQAGSSNFEGHGAPPPWVITCATAFGGFFPRGGGIGAVREPVEPARGFLRATPGPVSPGPWGAHVDPTAGRCPLKPSPCLFGFGYSRLFSTGRTEVSHRLSPSPSVFCFSLLWRGSVLFSFCLLFFRMLQSRWVACESGATAGRLELAGPLSTDPNLSKREP